MKSGRMRIAFNTLLAMIAFAGNSVICRLALVDGAIDPAGFTTIRMASAAITLAVIVMLRSGLAGLGHQGSWRSAATLMVYAVFFSFAYVSLSAASGALILFGFVQATMIVAALIAGERPLPSEWFGWSVAALGLVWLLLPGATAPPRWVPCKWPSRASAGAFTRCTVATKATRWRRRPVTS